MRRALQLFAFASALIVAAAAFAADATLDKARQLLDRGDAQAAYALLEPLQSKRAGEVEYDLLLGAAAIDAKRPSEAVFALERVLAVNPDHPQARALIARAYFMLGEVKTAQQEFDSLKQRPDVPQEARAVIQKYLDAIEQVLSAERTKIAGYLEATIGHDTNVNSAPSGNQIAIPFFGGALFTLSAAGTKASDNFLAAAGGVNLRHRFTRDAALIAGLDVNKRMNSRQDQFDTGYWNGNLGVNFTQERNNFTLGFQGQQFFVDNNRFRDAKGLIGQWQEELDRKFALPSVVAERDFAPPPDDARDVPIAIASLATARRPTL
ncbi:MAG: tetratricopeptide repeat protein, partial [Betaproteobacteria bacterium]|nr:tetratricopeptide repeat protein [Betaproteobacteria bacterium]